MDRWDVIGAVLLGLAVLWTMISAAGRESAHPWLVVGLLVGTGAAYVAGRRCTSRALVALPAGLAALTAVVLLVSPGALGGGPGGWPLGYSNAHAALAVQGVAAVGMAAAATQFARTRLLALFIAAVLTVETFLTGSAAGTLLAVVVLVISIIVCLKGVRRALVAIGVSAAVVVLSVVLTVYAGTVWDDGRVPDVAVEALSERRPQLWHDALEQVNSNPVRGVGPGLFSSFSPLALSDTDARWAHSVVLQQAAEQGVIGGLLVLLLAGWAFVALGRGNRPTVAVIAAVGLAALGIHGSIDFILHFSAVVIFAAVLVGVGSNRRVSSRPLRATSRRSPERESPD